MAAHMVGAWLHLRAAMPAGEYSRFNLLAKSRPLLPPVPLMLWQRIQVRLWNSSPPRRESTVVASLPNRTGVANNTVTQIARPRIVVLIENPCVTANVAE